MARKPDTMSVKITIPTMAALDMFNAEQRISTGRSQSLSDTIWQLIEQVAPHITERVAELERKTKSSEADSDAG